MEKEFGADTNSGLYLKILLSVVGVIILLFIILNFWWIRNLVKVQQNELDQITTALNQLQQENKTKTQSNTGSSVENKLEAGQFITNTADPAQLYFTYNGKNYLLGVARTLENKGLTSYVGVLDPNNNKLIIFSRNVFQKDGDTSSPLVTTINSYNVDTKEVRKIFEKVEVDNVYHLQGLVGQKLILWRTGFDNSPGPCFSPITAGAVDLYYLDVDNINTGLQKYNPSSSVLAGVDEEAQKCLLDVGVGN